MKNILIILLLISTGLQAQRNGNDRIKALKTAHITEALNLSSAEAEKFWPVYNKHEEQMETIKKQRRQEVMSIARGDMSSVSDSDINKLIDKMMEFQRMELQIKMSFIENLRKVLPPRKVLRLHRAEEDFKRKLVKLLRDRRGNR